FGGPDYRDSQYRGSDYRGSQYGGERGDERGGDAHDDAFRAGMPPRDRQWGSHGAVGAGVSGAGTNGIPADASPADGMSAHPGSTNAIPTDATSTAGIPAAGVPADGIPRDIGAANGGGGGTQGPLPRSGYTGSPPMESAAGPGPNPGTARRGSRLNEKYTFDTFVIGASNRFSHAAAVAVSEAPARAYNPLFIWGESGLGKTHLLHAVGHYAERLFPGMRVRYISTEEFTNDFINSLRDDRK